MKGRGIALGVALLACAPVLPAQQAGTGEFPVKAGFLYHFTRFVEWPASSFDTPTSPFRICIFGTDPFGSSLEALLERRVGPRPIAIERPRRIEALPRCHIAYFAGDATDALLAEGEAAPHAPQTLTVASNDAFARRGGMIALVSGHGHGRVRLHVNLTAIDAAELTVSAKLLEAAERRYAGNAVGG